MLGSSFPMCTSERLKGIDVFVVVSQTGSFTSAADKLNVSNSAISKSVSRLERRLSVKLFHSTTRRLVLTEAGTVFYKTVRVCSTSLSRLNIPSVMSKVRSPVAYELTFLRLTGGGMLCQPSSIW